MPGFGPPTPLFLMPSTGGGNISGGTEGTASLTSVLDSVEPGDSLGGIGVEADEDALEAEGFRADTS